MAFANLPHHSKTVLVHRNYSLQTAFCPKQALPLRGLVLEVALSLSVVCCQGSLAVPQAMGGWYSAQSP